MDLSNATELLARISRGESIPPEVTKAAIAELRQGRATAAQTERKGKVSKSKAATEKGLDLLKGLFE